MNPYLRAFYGGLETHGVSHVADVPLELESLRRAKADALHIHWAYPVWRDRSRFHSKASSLLRFRRLLRAARREGMSLLWTVHNLEHHEGGDGWDRLGERPLRNADLRIYTSAWARTVGEGASRRRGETAVIPIGDFDPWLSPDPGRDSARAALGIAPDTRLLLCFGQIRPYKGFDIAVRALRRLPPVYRLVVAGRPISPALAVPPRPPAHEHRLTLIQRELEEPELVRWISAADAVVLPYRRITGSAALLTALSRSRGVVATDLPYFREVLAPEPDAAVLVASGDDAALAAGVERFFTVSRSTREAAARRIASSLAWPDLVAPVAAFLERRGSVSRPS